nr:TPA_asm: hypothetical protein HUJ06_024953 [Nelumbo nucifera]
MCLAKMVQNFIEENNEKHSSTAKCGRNRCNCHNGNCKDSSEMNSTCASVSVNRCRQLPVAMPANFSRAWFLVRALPGETS